MPENIEPRRGLRPGAEQTGRRERAGKSQRVRNRDQRGEKIAAGEHQDGALARDRKLSKQQRRREPVVDQQSHLNGRNEGIQRRELHPGEWQHHHEGDEQSQHNRKREPALSRCRRQRRQQDARFTGTLVHQPLPPIPAFERIRRSDDGQSTGVWTCRGQRARALS
jgi:hypothetical protein